MKKIIIFSIISVCFGGKPKPIKRFVYEYLLITQSKMECSPTVWQDFREGYLRGKTIKFVDVLLDSLNNGLPPFKIAKHHFPTIDDLRVKATDGKEYELELKPPPVKANINYFSSFNN